MSSDYGMTPVGWQAIYEDGSEICSSRGAWNLFSQQSEIDGLPLFFSRKAIKELTLFDREHPRERSLHLLLREPRPCFAYARFASQVGTVLPDQWLYSVFGYLAPHEQEVVVIYATHFSYQLLHLKRPLIFPW